MLIANNLILLCSQYYAFNLNYVAKKNTNNFLGVQIIYWGFNNMSNVKRVFYFKNSRVWKNSVKSVFK